MPTQFLSYWRPTTADAALARGGLLNHIASNQYDRVNVGDTIWVVTVRHGAAYLIGRVDAARVVDQIEAGRLLKVKAESLWDASHHIIAEDRTAAPLREIAISDIAARLRFQSENDRLDIKNGLVIAGQHSYKLYGS